MDRNTSVRVENLSKCYRIGIKQDIHDSLAKSLFSFIKSPLSNYRKYRSLYNFDDINNGDNNADVIWAVRDVSFDIKEGEIVGIIGVNGAGKSTLLKILSRITDPTFGRVEIHGRVSSLLEVGTGFHPELTGRDNVYLNGTILGMRKKELDRKFDEIVDFSGVEKFIDTPVKRYSSGMKVRLAFAVAAHLEPEILIIDEVLAVGDSQFQKKCLNKMEDISNKGRTVLFVSHNMPAVTRLCSRTILLNNGQLLADGPSHKIVSIYMDSERGTRAVREWPNLTTAPGDDLVRLCAIRIRSEDGSITDTIDIRKPVSIEMEYEVLKPDHKMFFYFHLFNDNGLRLFESIDTDPSWRNRKRPKGRYLSTAWIPGNLLTEGTMYVAPCIRSLDPEIQRFRVNEAVAFQVIDSMEGESARVDCTYDLGGVVRPLLKWETIFSPVQSEISLGIGSKND